MCLCGGARDVFPAQLDHLGVSAGGVVKLVAGGRIAQRQRKVGVAESSTRKCGGGAAIRMLRVAGETQAP